MFQLSNLLITWDSQNYQLRIQLVNEGNQKGWCQSDQAYFNSIYSHPRMQCAHDAILTHNYCVKD